MADSPFGKMKYKALDERWVGYAPLPAFAAHATRIPDEPLTEEATGQMILDANQALNNLRDMLRERHGDKIDAAFSAIDADIEKELAKIEAGEDEEPDPKDVERERKRAERQRKRAAKLAAGLFPVRVFDSDGDGPSPQQEASMRHLAENERAVADAVLKEVWDSFQNAYSQEYWRNIAGLEPAASLDELRGKFAVTDLMIVREHRAGFAHLVFTVDSYWQDEHGLMAVYSPDTRESSWTTHDGLHDLTPSDDAGGEDEEWVETPHDLLVTAIFAGEDDRARELIAAGADINAVDHDREMPPLCLAVEHMEVENVRRLLAFGADPNLADADSGKTPLKMAKRAYRDMGFAPSKKKDPLLDAMMDMVKKSAGGPFADMKQRLEEIIAMLEQAGAK